tara:strand:+ start:1391 stop:1966 length:576 start_codon:yes stop_codon:yes gene_type:complete
MFYGLIASAVGLGASALLLFADFTLATSCRTVYEISGQVQDTFEYTSALEGQTVSIQTRCFDRPINASNLFLFLVLPIASAFSFASMLVPEQTSRLFYGTSLPSAFVRSNGLTSLFAATSTTLLLQMRPDAFGSAAVLYTLYASLNYTLHIMSMNQYWHDGILNVVHVYLFPFLPVAVLLTCDPLAYARSV